VRQARSLVSCPIRFVLTISHNEVIESYISKLNFRLVGWKLLAPMAGGVNVSVIAKLGLQATIRPMEARPDSTTV
jgi:hypothetical protein